MKQIIGGVTFFGNLEDTFKELGMDAKLLWSDNDKDYQVWELSDEDFERLSLIDDKDWKDSWGWWRYAEGSNMGGVSVRYNINNHYIKAWDGTTRISFEQENKKLFVQDRWFEPRKYETLRSYLCEEIGVSTEKNVCALATDLARQNNMTMAELFEKYQPKEVL